jgi:hypothetical protein
MDKLKITFAYETNGKSKLIEFSPVSYSSLKNKEHSFGVPQRIKRVFERKSFKIIEVHCKHWEGLSLQYTGFGYSVNKHNLFFHYKSF